MWGTAMDVAGWLRGLGLEQYEANFRDNKINVDLLPRLTNDDLKDIGVSALGDRLQLLDAIAALAKFLGTAKIGCGGGCRFEPARKHLHEPRRSRVDEVFVEPYEAARFRCNLGNKMRESDWIGETRRRNGDRRRGDDRFKNACVGFRTDRLDALNGDQIRWLWHSEVAPSLRKDLR
jgi:SAM domain (Sterile alpha motif)